MLTSIRGLMAATLVAGSALFAAPALAQDTAPTSEFTVSGDVSLVTDYRFRGISASNGNVAVQGTLGVSHDSGLYVGTWASSLTSNNGGYGATEVNLYGGWSGEVTSGLTVDVGMLYYLYPDADKGLKTDFFEPYASVSTTIGPVSATLGANYAWGQSATGDKDNLYVYTDLSAGIPDTPVTLNAHLGLSSGQFSPYKLTGTNHMSKAGLDYSIGASYAITPSLSAGVSYIGVQGHSIDKYSNDTVVGTLTLSF